MTFSTHLINGISLYQSCDKDWFLKIVNNEHFKQRIVCSVLSSFNNKEGLHLH